MLFCIENLGHEINLIDINSKVIYKTPFNILMLNLRCRACRLPYNIIHQDCSPELIWMRDSGFDFSGFHGDYKEVFV